MADYYWVGDTGNWSDYTNHWSDASGSPAGVYGNPPTLGDWAIFDTNSFGSANATVTIDADAYAQVLRADTVINTPTFVGTNSLSIGSMNGELTLGTLNWDYTGDIIIRSPGVSLTSAGNTLGNAIYIGIPDYVAELTIQDNLTCDYLNLGTGVLDFNGKNIITQGIDLTSGTIYFRNGSINTVYFTANPSINEVDLGTSIIVATGGSSFFAWNYGGTEILNAGSSNIYLSGTGAYFLGGGGTYNNVYFANDTTITGGNTFNYLELGAGNTYYFEAEKTQSLNTVMFDGLGTADPTVIRSITDNTQFIFNKTTGTVEAQYIDIKDSNAQGGALFIARNSTDSGGNNGWGFGGFTVYLVDSLGLTDNIDYTEFSYRGLTLGKKPHVGDVINLQPKAGYKYSYKIRKISN